MGEASSFLIQELTGERHIVELVGRALPYRPLKFSGEMRAEFTWYPGNPQATVQMIGPTEGTTEISGMWKDRFIRNFDELGIPVLGQPGKVVFDGGTVAGAADAVRVIDDFRRRGQLLEVNWNIFTRRGILKKFDYTILRIEDIEWAMTFEWMSQGEPFAPVAFGYNLSIEDLVNEVMGLVNKVIATVKAVFAVIARVQNLVNNAIDTITETASSLVDLAEQAVSLVTAPLETVQQLKAAYQTIGDKCVELADIVTSVPARALRITQDITGESQQDVLQAETWSRDVRAAARDLRALVAQRSQELAAQLDKQPNIPVVTPFQGQDFRAISTKQYGNPNQWKQIARYNQQKGSLPVVGRQLLIPRLSTVQRGK
jgi:hypothetical protein